MKKLPVGIENFKELIENQYYYIDKTELVKDILTSGAKVTLFTRPRRFGKTLNMSMLKTFFEVGTDAELFRNLKITENEEICKQYLGKYPVIFISLKSVDGPSYKEALLQLAEVITTECLRFRYLLDSDCLLEFDKNRFLKLLSCDGTEETVLLYSLKWMTALLEMHYKKKVIVLIDEYDVPLDKAYQYGYYDKMTGILRGMFGNVLKTNSSLELAILTGCLCISKESIFTGLNNFDVKTISDSRFDEYFGITEEEVKILLQDYQLTEYFSEAKEWYDGYLFGKKFVYCPWSVINYVHDKMDDLDAPPLDYWANCSSNSIIMEFLNKTEFDVSEKFELLLNGESILEEIRENLTYDEVMDSETNIWSLLYSSGYLTRDTSKTNSFVTRKRFFLKIPNQEIMDVFRDNVKRWTMNTIHNSNRKEFFKALWSGDTDHVSSILSDLLFTTISYHDYAESFYHAMVVGLLSNAGYGVESNYENGLGRSDIVLKDKKNRRAIVMEIKISNDEKDLPKDCLRALSQIEEKRYGDKIQSDGYRDVLAYGISFYKKECMVKKKEDPDVK